MIKAAEPPRYLVPLHSVSIWNVFFFFSPHPLSVPFICVLWSQLSRRVDLSQRLSRPVVAMQGKSSHWWQINRVDKSLKKNGPSLAGP